MEEDRYSPEVNDKLLSEYSMDLLQNFRSGIDLGNESPADESKDVELNLGLSLEGRFGVDPHEKRLVRSSSIAGIEILQRKSEGLSSAASCSIGSVIMQACSLATEAEEKRRKLKELRSLRRMERKRRISERRRSSLAARGTLVEKNSEGLVAVSVALHRFRQRSQGSLGSQGGSSPSVSYVSNKSHAQGEFLPLWEEPNRVWSVLEVLFGL